MRNAELGGDAVGAGGLSKVLIVSEQFFIRILPPFAKGALMRIGPSKLAALLGAVAFGLSSVAALAQPAAHVIIISIDGLHQADLTDPALAADIPHLKDLLASSVSYSNASTTTPSD